MLPKSKLVPRGSHPNPCASASLPALSASVYVCSPLLEAFFDLRYNHQGVKNTWAPAIPSCFRGPPGGRQRHRRPSGRGLSPLAVSVAAVRLQFGGWSFAKTVPRTQRRYLAQLGNITGIARKRHPTRELGKKGRRTQSGLERTDFEGQDPGLLAQGGSSQSARPRRRHRFWPEDQWQLPA